MSHRSKLKDNILRDLQAIVDWFFKSHTKNGRSKYYNHIKLPQLHL